MLSTKFPRITFHYCTMYIQNKKKPEYPFCLIKGFLHVMLFSFWNLIRYLKKITKIEFWTLRQFLVLRRCFTQLSANMLDTCVEELNCKRPIPISRLFFNWPVNGHCGIVFNRFYRLEIHSLIGWYFRPSLWTLAPMDGGTILVYCCPSIFSLSWNF